MKKAEVHEIKARFDADVSRFSNAQTGQVSVMDSKLALDTGREALRALNPSAKSLLDMGCGAGNWAVTILSGLPGLECTLLDISRAMLDKAAERVKAAGASSVTVIEGDFRSAPLPGDAFDLVSAGATLHHLRGEEEWESVFAKVYSSLKRGGVFLISDLVLHENEALTRYSYKRWADYLEEVGGPELREQIILLSEKEDTPRPLGFQLELLEKKGFLRPEILHKNGCFATFCAIKPQISQA